MRTIADCARLTTGVLVCLGLAFGGQAIADTCVEYDRVLYPAGSLVGLTPQGVAAWGDLAYVAAGEAGLYVIDISDPFTPSIVLTMGLGAPLVGVWCSSDRLLVLDDQSQLHVMIPLAGEAPRDANTFPLPWPVVDMVVDGHLAYIAWSDPGHPDPGGISVLDVSDISAPVILSTATVSDVVLAMDADLPHAGLLTPTSFRAVDLSDPWIPAPRPSLPLPGDIGDVAVVQDRAFLGEFYWSLPIVDLSELQEPPQYDGEYLMPITDGRILTRAGEHLLVGCWTEGHLYALDGDPDGTTATLGAILLDADPRQIAVTGTTVVIGCGEHGLRLAVFDQEDLPAVAGSVATPATVWDLAVRGEYAHAIAAGGRYQAVRIGSPTAPELAGDLILPATGQAIVVTRDCAFVAAGTAGVVVVDITDPDAPDHAGTISVPGTAQDICIVGDYAYVAAGTAGLQVIDVSGSDAWPIVAAISMSQEVDHIAATGSLVVLAGQLVLGVVDISTPGQPELRSIEDLSMQSSVLELGAGNGHAYLMKTGLHAWINYWITVFDLSDPDQPVGCGSADIPSFLGQLTVSGEYAYMAAGEGGLTVLDLSQPCHPEVIGCLATPGANYCVATTFEDYLVLGAGNHVSTAWRQCGDVTGVAIETLPAANELALDVQPNPFNPRTAITFTLARSGRARVEVYNLRGRRVATLADGTMAEGHHTLTWDGADASGHAVSSGPYLVRLETETGTTSRKVMLVR